MIRLQEGDLRIALPSSAKVPKFDDPASHWLSHCMKAVDFVVEFEDRTLFLEVKDPDDPRAASRERQRWAARFRSDELDQDLVQKYRDSFPYQWALGRVKKPIHYWVLVGLEQLTEADLLSRADALRRKLPVNVPTSTGWLRFPVAACNVFNANSWNRSLPAGYRVSRVTDAALS